MLQRLYKKKEPFYCRKLRLAILVCLVVFVNLIVMNPVFAGIVNEELSGSQQSIQIDKETKENIALIKKTLSKDYPGMFREAGGTLAYKFLTPGSDAYSDVLWDWDSWLSNVAIRQALLFTTGEKEKKSASEYEKGCILNFLSMNTGDGWIPISISRNPNSQNELFEKKKNFHDENMHKPCLVQHAAFIIQQNNGDVSWLFGYYDKLKSFLKNYHDYSRHEKTGLYYWQTDFAIGVDNDPSTFYRPHKSSGSIYLNAMMYKELLAMSYISGLMKEPEDAEKYTNEAVNLKTAIQNQCWDAKDGIYYSVDLNILPIDTKSVLHQGAPRTWESVIERIGEWSGFMSLWAGIATAEQAKRIVEEHIQNPNSFNANYGIRTLDKREKMYSLIKSGNPSCWLGPVWGISNYMTWKGLVNYGYTKEARELAIKTIHLFGEDLRKNGQLHEYYHPDTGEGLNNMGFQNWNYLVLNMIAWLEGDPVVSEF